MPRATTLLPVCLPRRIRFGFRRSFRTRPSSSSQTCSVVPFAGRLLHVAWLHSSSPSSLTAGTRVGSGRQVRGSPWLNPRKGRGKRSLLGFVVFPVWSSRHRGAACASERVLRDSRREGLEKGWREAGESFGERGWRKFLERGAVCECITLYILLG